MVRVFFVTANVGSVYESMETGLPIWIDEFISVIRSKKPEFVAVHFQETGGKNYITGSNVINLFFGQLVERMGQLNFFRSEGFADSLLELHDQWTALSSIYFVHESVQPHAVAIWDFQENCFKEVSASAKMYIGSELDLASRKQKRKWPLNFFPHCKWSRKGFLRTRWRIDGNVLDLVNIHLFHDSDNLLSISSSPSEFAQCRERGLKYALQILLSDSLEKCPLFIFGDFNFRVDTKGLMAALSKEFGDWKDDLSPVSFGSKTFICPDQELRFLHSYEWLRKYDFEFRDFEEKHKGILQEFEVNFPPTYPFEEEDNQPEKFIRSRPPSWCDRVLFTQNSKDIISQESPVEYNVLGSKACMGDHKPVYLSFILKSPSSNSLNDLSDAYGQSAGKVRSPLKLSPSEPSCNCTGSSTNSNPNSSTHGTPPNSSRKCKCIVSLIKDNLNFPKCRLLSRGSSVSVSASSLNPNIHNANCNNGIHKPSEESQPFCKHFSYKNWRSKQNTNEIHQEDKTTSCLSQIEPLISTDKPISNNKTDRNNDKLILPFPLQVEKDGDKNRENNIMSNHVSLPLNIQNLNVISSNSDKSSAKNLESSKLPFGWTRRQRDIEENTKNQSQNQESKSLLCSKCLIL